MPPKPPDYFEEAKRRMRLAMHPVVREAAERELSVVEQADAEPPPPPETDEDTLARREASRTAAMVELAAEVAKQRPVGVTGEAESEERGEPVSLSMTEFREAQGDA